jgi:hypothetical protein
MKQITLVTGLAFVLVVPTVAGAKPTPNAGDKRAAKSECNMGRGHSDATREAFLLKFTTFKACVKRKAVEEAVEAQQAHQNAAKECAAERGNTDATREAFRNTYGTEGSDRMNAFGKCVSQKAKAKEHEADEQDQEDATTFRNAAHECADERGDTDATRQAFRTQYGTEGSNYRNAFGKCVSQKVHEANEERQAEEQPAAPTS